MKSRGVRNSGLLPAQEHLTAEVQSAPLSGSPNRIR